MMRMMAVIVWPILIATLSWRTIDLDVDASAVLESAWSPRDFELRLDPESEEWREAPRVTASRNYVGEPIAGPPTEIRSRWTNANLYLLYVNPYDELNLKPDPTPSVETPRLWNWDVAEAFIGSGADRMTRYKEFQVSPQSEWVDLDIDREDAQGQAGMNHGALREPAPGARCRCAISRWSCCARPPRRRSRSAPAFAAACSSRRCS